MHFEVDRSLNEEAAEDLVAHIERVLARSAAGRARLPADGRSGRAHDRGCRQAGARFPDKEIHESVEFLQWLTDDNFIYLGLPRVRDRR